VEEVTRGRLRWQINRLEVGERREFNVQCACVADAPSACSLVTVKADGGINLADQKCVEILPVQPPAGRGAATPPAQANLRLSMVSSAGPARVGAPLTLFVYVENIGSRPERDVAVRVLVPQEVTPIEVQIEPRGAFQTAGPREFRFTAIPELRPGERREFVIPVRVDRPGTVNVWAQVAATGMAQPISEQSPPLEILSATQ
jgi:hypothetical protein